MRRVLAVKRRHNEHSNIFDIVKMLVILALGFSLVAAVTA
jgi:hypothetical protein